MDPSLMEKRASDRILEKGVAMKMRAPFLLRLFGKKTVELTVTSPKFGTLCRVASYYLSTGIQFDQLKDVTHEQALGLMVAHGKGLTKAVAVALLNGYWSGKLLTNPLAWYIRSNCTAEEISTVVSMILLLGGTADFMNTTRSVRLLNATIPRMGPQTEES